MGIYKGVLLFVLFWIVRRLGMFFLENEKVLVSFVRVIGCGSLFLVRHFTVDVETLTDRRSEERRKAPFSHN